MIPTASPISHDPAGGQEDAVAGAAHAELAAALQHRPDRDRRLLLELVLGERLLDLGQEDVGDDLALLADDRLARLAARERLVHVLGQRAAEQALVDALGHVQRQVDVVLRLAVLLADDHVLGDVDQAPREVARVGRAERGVGEALAGAVGRDEVLEHRQALHEVGLDRALDDLALRIRHQAAHAGQLADLLEGAAGAGVGHHEDRVQLVERLLHRLRDVFGGLRPEVDDLLVALLLGDEAALVELLDVRHPLLVAGEDLLLRQRDDDVVLRDRDPGLGRVVEAERLDLVEHARDHVRAEAVGERGDERVHLLLRERAVDERPLLGRVAHRLLERPVDLLVEDHASGRGQHELAVPAVLDRLLEVGLAVLDRPLDLLLGGEALRARVESSALVASRSMSE